MLNQIRKPHINKINMYQMCRYFLKDTKNVVDRIVIVSHRIFVS